MSDISALLLWYLTLFLIGIISLPLTTFFFNRAIDKGYIFTKAIGIFLSSYIVWLLASLHILPFTRLTLLLILLALAIINLWLVVSLKKKNMWEIPWKWIIGEEILFFLCLSLWSYVRATEPSIRGLEKFMDFGFVNSILRSTFFPPLDMWLTKSPDYTGGYFINYYYFGHYINAFLTKLSGISSTITYNLMMATLFAFTFSLTFSLGANLVHFFSTFHKKISPLNICLIGLLAAFIVTLGGNLHTVYLFTSGYPNEDPKPPWQLELGYHPERYWYPNATRFIPFTIHEFPSYSFVVADLHGHVSDIPFVLLTLFILLSLLQKTSRLSDLRPPAGEKKKPGRIAAFLAEFEQHTSLPFSHILFLGVLLAIMYMTNAWDGLIYMILAGLTFLYINIRKRSETKEETLGTALYKAFSASLFLLFFFLLASLPFSLNFRPFASGIGVLCAPSFLLGKTIGPLLFEAGKCQKSPFFMLAILWGFFYFQVTMYFIFVIFPNIIKRVRNYKTKHNEIFEDRFLSESRRTSGEQENFPRERKDSLVATDVFALLLIFISTLLLIFPEFFYLKDIYPAHYRANTMFKLGYQAFMMLGLVSAYIVFRIKYVRESNRISLFHILYNTLFVMVFTLIAIYPYFSINSYYGALRTYVGLDGLNWFATQYPDDYKGVLWLRSNVQNQPVIAEANGDSYTDYARVSANTGLPTIIGWPVHEWLWRGSYDEAGKRIPEVATLYESKDPQDSKAVIKKYQVEYIFVGTLEREKYKNLNEEKLESSGRVVFESGKTKIYKVSAP